MSSEHKMLKISQQVWIKCNYVVKSYYFESLVQSQTSRYSAERTCTCILCSKYIQNNIKIYVITVMLLRFHSYF